MTLNQENTATVGNEPAAQQVSALVIDAGDCKDSATQIDASHVVCSVGGESKEWPGTYLSNEEAVKILQGRKSSLRPDLSHYGYRFIKRIFDIIASLIAIIVCFIPALIICLLICIKSPGAGPLYSQPRVKRIKGDGSFSLFRMWKIRSMIPNADALLKDLQDSNEADGPLFKIKEDPRVIPGIGTFIRKHSIDEFGQLINVLKGDMSFIGPRPPLPNEVVSYDNYCMQRLTVKPGCGGIWQTTARSDGSFAEMVELDLKYIENAGICYDLSLIYKTAKVVVTGEGAY